MLLWQRKSVPKFAFGAQLSFVIVLMHAIALLLLCMHSVAVHDELCIDVSRSYVIGTDIFVVPFQKTVKQLPVVVPQSVVHEAQRDTTEIKDVKLVQKKIETAQPAKPEPSSKEREPIQPELEKAPIKEPEKPAEPEPSSKERVAQDSKAEEKKAAQVPSADIPKPKALNVPKSAVPTAQTQPMPQYIGTRQLQTMQIQQSIVQQVQMHWHPPEGLESDLEVVLVIHIGYNGDVTDIETQQSSGVFAYDVHARSAVYEMQFPKPCWGKTITIAFK